jgi:hypothetical protein
MYITERLMTKEEMGNRRAEDETTPRGEVKNQRYEI